MLPFFARLTTKQKQSWKNRYVNRLGLECLEGRITPAVGGFDPNTGLVWLEYTSATASMYFETVTFTNDGTNITATGDVSGTTDFTTSSVTGFRVWSSGGGGGQILNFAGTTGYSLPSGIQAGYGLDSLTINAAINTESSDFAVQTWKGVSITAPVTTTTGNISITTLKGPGNYSGVNISSNVTTERGNISIVGKGGSDASGQQSGILIGNSAKIFAGGNGSVSLSGTGGTNAGPNNRGVYITRSSTVQTGGSGSISITGVSGDVSNYGNDGVLINSGSMVTSLGSGNINIIGFGGKSPGTINPGIRIADANTVVRANGGTISISGSEGIGVPETGKQASDYSVIVEGGASVSPSSAGTGNTVVDTYNSNNDVMAIDLAKPLTLPAGTYKASSFNRQIASLAPSESSGSITPALVIAQGDGYVPVAVGASSSYAGPSGFASAPFGGSDTFTLSQATKVYAAMHWQAPHYVGGPYRMPVGYRSGSGSSNVFYAEGYGAGAALPYVGLLCAGTSQATFSRSYDFSITIDPASPPSGSSEPPTSGNLIANGDFSLGNIGFGSQYVLTPGNIGGAQTYDVANSWDVLAYGDHTTGTGKMLGVNGSNIADIVFWHQNVHITPNTNYTFSFWTSSWFPGATPLAILVDGAAIGTASVPAGTAQWQQITVSWNSGNRSSANFSLAAIQGFDIGGDFAIDDISLVRTNRQPVAASFTNRSDVTGDQISFSIATGFSDPDSDTLTFNGTGLPEGLSISSTGLISGTIGSTAAKGSPYAINITANDGQGGSVTGSFNWTVSAAASNFTATIGSGNIQTQAGGGSNNLIVIDLSNPIALTSGNYKANSFGREFTDFSNFNGESFPTKGDIIPLVVVNINGSYQAIAIGDTSTYAGPFGFSSVAFGNTNSFSLTAPTTVYAGIYWAAPLDGVEYRCPVGYTNSGPGFSYYFHGVGAASRINQGPELPQLNVPITSAHGGLFSQKWDFNIDISQISGDGGSSSNLSPLFSSLSNRSDIAGDQISFSIATAFSDPDSDTLTFTATGLPDGLYISSAGLISGTIGTAAGTGSPYTINVTANDGRDGSVTGSFTWIVLPINSNPAVGILGSQNSKISDIINLSIASSFSDPDNDFLTYSADNLPTGLVMSADGVVTGTVLSSANISTPYIVNVTVADGRGGLATGSFYWTINAANRQPAVGSLTNRSNITSDQISFSIATAFSDPDSDTLTFTATGLPDGLSISSAGLISGTIGFAAHASSPLTTLIIASDGRSGSVTGSFMWTVAINDSKTTSVPPVLNGPVSRSFSISSNSILHGFTIADSDAGSTLTTLSASVDRGALTSRGKAGTRITLTGTLSQLNASLAQLSFKSANFDASPAKLTITAKDASGNSATLSSTLVPTQNLITIITDPQLAGKKSVLLVGTSTADIVSVTGSGTNYCVVMNGRTVNLTGITGRILAFGLAGNDSIDMPSVAISTICYGGDGNDIIRTGSATDWIFGENGADLLAGGLGIDHFNGGADNDLLFDGSVTPKATSVSLASTLSLWKTLANPTNANYTTIYNRLTITSDKNARDIIQGTAGLDIFFASATDILDKITSERTRIS